MKRTTLAVFGAPGAQGGSVIRHLTEAGGFKVRALSHNPDAYSGPADEARHVGPDNDSTLIPALAGTQDGFLVSNFRQPGTDEIVQTSHTIAAAKANGVGHFVRSMLLDLSAVSKGGWNVPLDLFAGFFPQALELGNLLGYFEEFTNFGPEANRRIREAREQSVKRFTGLGEWMAANSAASDSRPATSVG